MRVTSQSQIHQGRSHTVASWKCLTSKARKGEESAKSFCFPTSPRPKQAPALALTVLNSPSLLAAKMNWGWSSAQCWTQALVGLKCFLVWPSAHLWLYSCTLDMGPHTPSDLVSHPRLCTCSICRQLKTAVHMSVYTWTGLMFFFFKLQSKIQPDRL